MYKAITSNKLFQDTLIYGLTNALYTGLPLLLLPFLVVTLKPEDYGYVDLFRSISMVLVPVLGLSTVQSIGRFYFDLDKATFKNFVSSIHIFLLCTTSVGLLITFFISPYLSPIFSNLLIACILYFLFHQYIESLLIIYRITNKPKVYLVMRVGQVVVELLLLFAAYILLETIDWKFRVFPTILASMILAFVAFKKFKDLGYSLNFSKRLLQKALIYSSPLIVHMVAGYALNIGDRFFIKYYLSDEDLGNYAVAYQIGMSINFFYTSFNLAWTPTYFKWMKEKKVAAIMKVKRVIFISLPLLGVVVLVSWLVISELFINDTSYSVSNELVAIIILSYVLYSLYKFNANFFLFKKLTDKLSKYSLTAAIVSVILNIVLIPSLGIMGAGLSTFFSFAVLFVLVSNGKAIVNKYDRDLLS
ncbi:lipopolysaccharide biosynthesis protein [Croceiramulus getboli]|nr:oligosaccharide flippase family protein [Flavobacteriaceae bacterium YJPT1-3]